MKRILTCVLTVLLGLCCFTACNNSGGESSASSESKATNNIQIVQNEVTLMVGESVQLEATIDLENVYIFWSIRDENIATVSDNGLLTGVAEGETICYASFSGEKSMCLVKVVGATAQPLLSATTPYIDGITLFVGDTFNPLVTVKVGDLICEDAQIEYIIADTEKGIFGVEDGSIVAYGIGSATLTIKATYGEQKVELTIPVSVLDSKA